MDKHTRIRIESQCKKFCQIINNEGWKKTRNLHAICLLDMIINSRYEEPYNKFAPDGPLPYLPKAVVKSRLSEKFLNYSKNNFNLPVKNTMKRAFSDNSLNNKMNMTKPLSPEDAIFKYEEINSKNHYKEINKFKDPELLKKYIEKLKYKVNETQKIINKQKEEKEVLLKKINELENLLKFYKI